MLQACRACMLHAFTILEGINLYSLQDLTGKEILGRIYKLELLKVHYDPDDRKIKKIILKRKTANLVEFEDYPAGSREEVRKK